jgi:hypothetical protein
MSLKVSHLALTLPVAISLATTCAWSADQEQMPPAKPLSKPSASTSAPAAKSAKPSAKSGKKQVKVKKSTFKLKKLTITMLIPENFIKAPIARGGTMKWWVGKSAAMQLSAFDIAPKQKDWTSVQSMQEVVREIRPRYKDFKSAPIETMEIDGQQWAVFRYAATLKQVRGARLVHGILYGTRTRDYFLLVTSQFYEKNWNDLVPIMNAVSRTVKYQESAAVPAKK